MTFQDDWLIVTRASGDLWSAVMTLLVRKCAHRLVDREENTITGMTRGDCRNDCGTFRVSGLTCGGCR